MIDILLTIHIDDEDKQKKNSTKDRLHMHGGSSLTIKLLVSDMVAMVYLELMQLHELFFLLALSSSHTLTYQIVVCQQHKWVKKKQE